MRQSRNQIQADIAKPRLTCLMHKVASILSRVQATHSAEFLVVERLRSDAQTIHAKAAESAQRARVCRPWRRFQSEFDVFALAKPVPQSVQDKFKTLVPEQGRCASADVNRIDRERKDHGRNAVR